MSVDNFDTSDIPRLDTPTNTSMFIRTSDNIDIEVNRERIAHALPRFFAFTRPISQGTDSDGKTIVFAKESNQVWEQLLAIINLTPAPPLTSIDAIYSLLKAGSEYGMEDISGKIQYMLLQPDLLENEPIGVYSIASSCGLVDVAKIAARRTLQLPTLYGGNKNVLRSITAADYLRLVEYRRLCGDAASALAKGTADQALPRWIAEKEAYWKLCATKCHGPCSVQSQTLLVREDDQKVDINVRIRKSWIAYLSEVGKQLEQWPDPSRATSTELFEPVVASAIECGHCAKSIYGSVIAFSKVMEGAVKKAISEIVLET